MHHWNPATDAEVAMREALAAADQDRYFRILARSDLLLPVSAESLAGRAPMGWGTWTTGDRTHVLAFTSPAALRLCLSEPSGSFRSVPFPALAAEWPNYEWWLAINPGLPIEAYLPSWFITQLVRAGEVRVPGRTAAGARARMAQSDLAAAISGRIRATDRSRTSAPGPATPPPPPRTAAAPSTALAPVARVRGYVPLDEYGLADRHRRPGGYGPEGYGWSDRSDRQPGYEASPEYGRQPDDGRPPGHASSGYAPPDAYGRPQGYPAADSEPYQAQTPAPPTRVTARVGPPPVETVDAEIVDTGPDDGYRPGSTGPSGSTTTTTTAGPGLGARLRGEDFSTSTGSARPSSDGPSVRADPPPQPTPAEPTSWTPRRGMIEDAEIVSPTEAWAVGFVPANETEVDLLAAAETNNTDSFLSTLLLARVILPVPISMPPGSRPRDKYFPWQIEEVDGERRVAVFTSPERLADYGPGHFGPDMSTMSMRFIELIEAWPSPRIEFAINPGTPVGTTLPGSQIVALASWAAEVGLRDDSPGEIAIAARKEETPASMGVAGAPTVGAAKAIVMQRTVPPGQLPFYLERGYDRVSGFVNRASEVAHLKTPRTLYRALGLVYSGSQFGENDPEVHVLRWVAHRPDLYRLPYGGQNETAMRAMQGWVIERAPFRGNGFAPGDSDVVAEFKVDSARLPHGAQMWRLTQDGTETMVASFDADSGRWVRTP